MLMNKRFLYLLFFFFSLPSFSFEGLDSLVNIAIQSKTLPGGVVLIGHRDQFIYLKNYVSPKETIYDLASLTKVITATSILILEEERKLKLSDKLSKYYSEFNTQEKKEISIEDLLRHNSGLPAVVRAHAGEKYPDFIHKTLSLPLEYRPGEKTVYSDVGYIILGDLIQKISNLSLEEFTRLKIFEPLAMNQTGFKVKDADKHLCAPTGNSQLCLPHDPKAYYLYPHQLGHAGVFSTILDFSKMAQLFLNKGIYQNKRILKEVSVRKMSVIHGDEIRGTGFDLLSPYASAPRGDIFPAGISYGHTGFTGTTMWIDPKSEHYYLFFSNRVFLGQDKTGKPFTELRRSMAHLIGKKIYDGLK